MPTFLVISKLLEKATAHGTRSTVVGPLILMATFLMVGLLASFVVQAPNWVGGTLLGLLICDLVLFVIAYITFMRTDPDALRSEKFTIQKLAIERGLIGDDAHGLMEPDIVAETPPMISGSTVQIETDK